MRKNKKIVVVLVHIIVWICFFMLPFIFSPMPKDLPNLISRHMFTQFVVINIILLGFYYLNTLVLIPKYLFRKKWLIYIPIVVFFLFAFIEAPEPIAYTINGTSEKIIDNEFKENYRKRRQQNNDTIQGNNKLPMPPKDKKSGNGGGRKNKNAFRYFQGSFVVFLLVLFVGICAKIFEQWQDLEHNTEKIKTEKLQTELSFLRSQVNPHFFFNTLNNIYSLAVVQSEKTAPAVMKLSSIMRYILTETQTERVLLENEITFLKNYIDLQLVRLTDKVDVNFLVSGNVSDKQIAPLLFISFVENAFKYGVSTKENTNIQIELAATNEKVHFKVLNTVVKANNGIMDTTGIGINNVKRRLELLYPNKHTLKVEEQNNTFLVDLQIEWT